MVLLGYCETLIGSLGVAFYRNWSRLVYFTRIHTYWFMRTCFVSSSSDDEYILDRGGRKVRRPKVLNIIMLYSIQVR